MCIQRVLDKLYEAFEIFVLRTDSIKQLEQLLVCLCPSEYIEGLFSVQVHLHSSTQMCVQRVLDKLYEALEVDMLPEKHRGKKLFRLSVLFDDLKMRLKNQLSFNRIAL